MPRSVAPMSHARQPFDAVFGSIAGVRIMRVLVGHGGALSVRRIADDTHLTPKGVRDALQSLEHAGVVEALGSGRSRLFAVSHGHPLTPALHTLFESECRRYKDILEAVKRAAAVDHVVAVWLFGSVARSEDGINSDTDIAVVIDAPPAEASRIADGIRDSLFADSKRLGFEPSVVSLTLAEIRAMKDGRSALWADLRRDARVLMGAHPDRLEADGHESAHVPTHGGMKG